MAQKMLYFLRTLGYYNYFRNHLYFYPRYAWELLLRRFTSKRRAMIAEVFFEGRCNLKCWHCSSSEYIEKKRVKSLCLKELDGIVRKLRSVGVLTICYVGGEPTINPELLSILRMTNKYGILPTIITNATLLTPEKIDALFKAGLANLGFSMQSLQAEVHDKLVGKQGALAYMKKMIDYCLEKKYTLSVCVVPTNENLGNDEFQDMVEYATQRGIRLNVNLPAPIGKWANFTSCALTAVSIKKLESNFFPLPNFVSDFKNTNLSGKMHCPMGENNVYVFPDGEVCPCTFTHISFGNILQESAQTILKRMDSSPTLQNIKRDGMCPISMDKDFIAKVHGAINSSNHYPPRAEDVGF